MSCVLELPQLPEDDGVSQGEVGSTGIHAELHAKGPAGREPLLETTLSERGRRCRWRASSARRRPWRGDATAPPRPAPGRGVHSPAMTRRHFPWRPSRQPARALCGVWRPPGGRPRRALAQTSFVYAADESDHATARGRWIVWSSPSAASFLIRDAAVAIEDRRFYQHHGIDGRAILRASYVNLRDGSIEEGGRRSPAAAGQEPLHRGRTHDRPQAERSIARWQLEDRLSKEEILTRYLNTVYFGQGAYGVQAAARTFFGVDAIDLNLARSALLAGLITSPGHFDPYEYPSRANDADAWCSARCTSSDDHGGATSSRQGAPSISTR